MGSLVTFKRRFLYWFSSLSGREKAIVGSAVIGFCVYLLYLPVVAAQEKIEDNERLVRIRKNDLESIDVVLRRYRILNARLQKLQARFDGLPTSFEPVTKELDRIIRGSIRSESYELNKAQSPAPFGEKYEKQNFTLKIRQLSLQQLTRLLFELDRSEIALFIGNVEILASRTKGEYNPTIEVITLRRKPA